HVITDPLDTPRELVSDDGEVVWAGQLRTWGRLDRWAVKDDDTRLARRLPRGYRTAANDPYIEVELRFQNQWEDPESGLYYNYQRYYDPDTGQYLSPDPIGLRGGLRPHGYVHNPVGWVDPWGLAGCPPEGNVAKGTDDALRALPAAKLADHHVFPQQYRKFFEQRGINIDEHTVTVGQTNHLKGVHGSGLGEMPGGWNQR